MVDYISASRVTLTAETSIRITAFPTGVPFVAACFETSGQMGADFGTFNLFLAAAKAAEYGAALIEAAKLAGWVESAPVPVPAEAAE